MTTLTQPNIDKMNYLELLQTLDPTFTYQKSEFNAWRDGATLWIRIYPKGKSWFEEYEIDTVTGVFEKL